MAEAPPVLLKEGLITLDDLEGVDVGVLVQLGLSQAAATKLLGAKHMMEEAVARPLREQQAEAERRRAFQCDRDNFPNGRGPCPKCGSCDTFRGDPLYNHDTGLRGQWYNACRDCHYGWK